MSPARCASCSIRLAERRCTVIAVGLRGDAEPLMLIGARLARLGVRVRCATHTDYVPLAKALGLETMVIGGTASAFLAGPAGRAMRDRLARPREFARFFDAYLGPFHARLLREAYEAAADAELVVCWPWMRMAVTLGDALRVPVAVASTYPAPYLPTAEFPCPFNPDTVTPSSPRGMRRSWREMLPALAIGQAAIDQFRRAHGLAPLPWRAELRRARALPHLFGYAPAVLPRPRDWPSGAAVTGAWFGSSPNPEPPASLVAFLATGPPPVAIGFSSQVGRDRDRFTATIRDGVAAAGVRAVVVTGFGGMTAAAWPDQVCAVESVSYEWLFPRCAAVVHHGGSGSVSAALKAGVPGMAVPFGYDQPFWGQRLYELGVGPPPMAADHLSADGLAAALHALVEDPGYRARALALAASLRLEDGAGVAADRLLGMLD